MRALLVLKTGEKIPVYAGSETEVSYDPTDLTEKTVHKFSLRRFLEKGSIFVQGDRANIYLTHMCLLVFLVGAVICFFAASLPTSLLHHKSIPRFSTRNPLSPLWYPGVSKSSFSRGVKNVLVLDFPQKMNAGFFSVYSVQNEIINCLKTDSPLYQQIWFIFHHGWQSDQREHSPSRESRPLLLRGTNDDNGPTSKIKSLSRTVLSDLYPQRPISQTRWGKVFEIDIVRTVAYFNKQPRSVFRSLRVSGPPSLNGLPNDCPQGEYERPCSNPFRPCYEFVPPMRLILVVLIMGCAVAVCGYCNGLARLLCIPLMLIAGVLLLSGHRYWCENGNNGEDHRAFVHKAPAVCVKDIFAIESEPKGLLESI